jgi:A/G-specific adenine glycosylase
LAWYDRHRRRLPWRAAPGEPSDPYRVWLSEIMLQQTTVKAVAPYYARFLARWPDVRALAAAPLDEVLKTWAGLGYYSRARNLHACALAVVERHDGIFPADEAELRALPGIGGYTAAAIAAIAYDVPAIPIDGNVERVIARLYAVETPLPAAKREIAGLALGIRPQNRAGDFAQALMDLGATICTPKRPACGLCPWHGSCAAEKRGDAEAFPRRTPKREGALRRGAAFVVRRTDGYLLLRSRPPRGLLGGMTEVPTTAWTAEFDEADALKDAPRFSRHHRAPSYEIESIRSRQTQRAPSPLRGGLGWGSGGKSRASTVASRLSTPTPNPSPQGGGERAQIAWRRVPGVVRHVFTHFPLELVVYAAHVPAGARAPKGTRWVALDAVAGEALPSLMRKVIAHGLRL